MKKRILVAEDDAAVREVLGLYLKDAGYEFLSAANGKEGIQLAKEKQPDAVIVDIMMPEMDGYEMIRELRTFSDIPVMILSARAFEEDRIKGLSLGADVYVDKPFRPREVIAYVDAMLRRRDTETGKEEKQVTGSAANRNDIPAAGYADAQKQGQDPNQKESFLTIREYTLDLLRKELVYRRDRIPLTAAEYSILEILFRRPGQIYSKKQLYELMFHDKIETDMNSVPVHVSNLRAKMRENGMTEELIETVWGLGYRVERRKS